MVVKDDIDILDTISTVFQVLEGEDISYKQSAGADDLETVVCYIRNEVKDREFSGTSLASLGITEGRALLRVSTRSRHGDSTVRCIGGVLQKKRKHEEHPAPTPLPSPSQHPGRDKKDLLLTPHDNFVDLARKQCGEDKGVAVDHSGKKARSGDSEPSIDHLTFKEVDGLKDSFNSATPSVRISALREPDHACASSSPRIVYIVPTARSEVPRTTAGFSGTTACIGSRGISCANASRLLKNAADTSACVCDQAKEVPVLANRAENVALAASIVQSEVAGAATDEFCSGINPAVSMFDDVPLTTIPPWNRVEAPLAPNEEKVEDKWGYTADISGADISERSEKAPLAPTRVAGGGCNSPRGIRKVMRSGDSKVTQPSMGILSAANLFEELPQNANSSLHNEVSPLRPVAPDHDNFVKAGGGDSVKGLSRDTNSLSTVTVTRLSTVTHVTGSVSVESASQTTTHFVANDRDLKPVGSEATVAFVCDPAVGKESEPTAQPFPSCVDVPLVAPETAAILSCKAGNVAEWKSPPGGKSGRYLNKPVNEESRPFESVVCDEPTRNKGSLKPKIQVRNLKDMIDREPAETALEGRHNYLDPCRDFHFLDHSYARQSSNATDCSEIHAVPYNSYLPVTHEYLFNHECGPSKAQGPNAYISDSFKWVARFLPQRANRGSACKDLQDSPVLHDTNDSLQWEGRSLDPSTFEESNSLDDRALSKERNMSRVEHELEVSSVQCGTAGRDAVQPGNVIKHNMMRRAEEGVIQVQMKRIEDLEKQVKELEEKNKTKSRSRPKRVSKFKENARQGGLKAKYVNHSEDHGVDPPLPKLDFYLTQGPPSDHDYCSGFVSDWNPTDGPPILSPVSPLRRTDVLASTSEEVAPDKLTPAEGRTNGCESGVHPSVPAKCEADRCANEIPLSARAKAALGQLDESTRTSSQRTQKKMKMSNNEFANRIDAGGGTNALREFRKIILTARSRRSRVPKPNSRFIDFLQLDDTFTESQGAPSEPGCLADSGSGCSERSSDRGFRNSMGRTARKNRKGYSRPTASARPLLTPGFLNSKETKTDVLSLARELERSTPNSDTALSDHASDRVSDIFDSDEISDVIALVTDVRTVEPLRSQNVTCRLPQEKTVAGSGETELASSLSGREGALRHSFYQTGDVETHAGAMVAPCLSRRNRNTARGVPLSKQFLMMLKERKLPKFSDEKRDHENPVGEKVTRGCKVTRRSAKLKMDNETRIEDELSDEDTVTVTHCTMDEFENSAVVRSEASCTRTRVKRAMTPRIGIETSDTNAAAVAEDTEVPDPRRPARRDGFKKRATVKKDTYKTVLVEDLSENDNNVLRLVLASFSGKGVEVASPEPQVDEELLGSERMCRLSRRSSAKLAEHPPLEDTVTDSDEDFLTGEETASNDPQLDEELLGSERMLRVSRRYFAKLAKKSTLEDTVTDSEEYLLSAEEVASCEPQKDEGHFGSGRKSRVSRGSFAKLAKKSPLELTVTDSEEDLIGREEDASPEPQLDEEQLGSERTRRVSRRTSANLAEKSQLEVTPTDSEEGLICGEEVASPEPQVDEELLGSERMRRVSRSYSFKWTNKSTLEDTVTDSEEGLLSEKEVASSQPQVNEELLGYGRTRRVTRRSFGKLAEKSHLEVPVTDSEEDFIGGKEIASPEPRVDEELLGSERTRLVSRPYSAKWADKSTLEDTVTDSEEDLLSAEEVASCEPQKDEGQFGSGRKRPVSRGSFAKLAKKSPLEVTVTDSEEDLISGEEVASPEPQVDEEVGFEKRRRVSRRSSAKLDKTLPLEDTVDSEECLLSGEDSSFASNVVKQLHETVFDHGEE